MSTYNVTFATANEPKNAVTKNPITVTSRTVTLVEPCEILNPTITTYGSYINANYIMGLFGRNYYIVSQTLSNGRNFLQLKCDVLTSFSSNIYGTTQFVSRSQTGYDNSIPDNIVPIKQDTTYTVKSIGEPITTTENYIIGVI